MPRWTSIPIHRDSIFDRDLGKLVQCTSQSKSGMINAGTTRITDYAFIRTVQSDYTVYSRPSTFYATNVAWQDLHYWKLRFI